LLLTREGGEKEPGLVITVHGLPPEQLRRLIGRNWSQDIRTYDLRHGQGDLREQGRSSHKFWVAHHGRYVIRIDANRPGVYRWPISLEGRSVRKGLASDRDQADAAVSDALDELSR
jgi:hypothetical protein